MTASTAALPDVRRPELAPYAVTGAVGAAVVIVFGNANVDHAAGESGGLGPALITGGLCVALAATLFGIILRRHTTPRTRAVLAVLAVLSLAVFWTGLTPILAAGTAAASRRASGRLSVVGWVGAVAGVLAAAWSVVAAFV